MDCASNWRCSLVGTGKRDRLVFQAGVARVHRCCKEIVIVNPGELELTLVRRLVADLRGGDSRDITVLGIDRLRRLNIVPGEETATSSGRARIAEARPPRNRRVECAIAVHDIGRECDDIVLGIESEVFANAHARGVRELE